jgi:hypothetical protein
MPPAPLLRSANQPDATSRREAVIGKVQKDQGYDQRESWIEEPGSGVAVGTGDAALGEGV